MKVLVCGGRDFADLKFIFHILDEFHRKNTITELIEGNAKGVDRISGFWARHRGIKNTKYPANWKRQGVAAGIIRNQQMLDRGKPDVVIAFPGGRGTADMVARSERNGFKVIRIEHKWR